MEILKLLFLQGCLFSLCTSSELLESVEHFSIFDSIKTQGFYEIVNRDFLKTDYGELYKNFDVFIKVMRQDREFAQQVYDSEKEFLFDEARKLRYCSAPPSFRDPREHARKRFSKVYFQFIKEHYDLIRGTYALELYRYPEVRLFLEDMLRLDELAKKMFEQNIENIEKSYSGFKKAMYGDYGELTVITKIVRYEKTKDQTLWATTPHFDKSGLSIIWGSSDADDESLLICEDSENPSLEKLKKPQRLYSRKDEVTSALLIPGLALAEVGIDMKPTLHGVLSIQKEYRYAVISFALIPDISMTHLKTDFI